MHPAGTEQPQRSLATVFGGGEKKVSETGALINRSHHLYSNCKLQIKFVYFGTFLKIPNS